MIAVTCVAAAAIFGTFIAAVSSLGYCAFDPPPGDVAPMTLTNDLTRVVSFEECLDSQCGRRDGANGSGPVSPGSSDEWNHELCGEQPVGVVDSSGHLVGCVILPAEDPAKVTHFYASTAGRCR